MEKLEGVANTLFVPLVARIEISKEFPEYFMDRKALELEKDLPEGAKKGSSQYSNMASVARYYNMDRMVMTYIRQNAACNIVYLGAGLETAYDRMYDSCPDTVKWYEADLPEVIETRRKIFGSRPNEVTIPGDMFKMEWVNKMDSSLPTMLIVSGVFQYFCESEVTGFIHNCKAAFPNGEMIFDATSKSGLKFTNWFIKRTGNTSALMYFYVNDSAAFAKKSGTELVEEKLFFSDAIRMLKKRLTLVTRVFMATADQKKQTLILHLKW